MNAQDQKTIDDLGARAGAVADLDAKKNAARADADAARVEALEALAVAVRPALDVIGDRPVIAMSASGNETRAAWRGVFICAGPKRRESERDPRGSWVGGRDLYLAADGWHQIAYELVADSVGRAAAARAYRSVDTVVPVAQLAADVDLPAAVARLSKLLDEAIHGSKAERIADAHALAARLRTVAALLRA